MTSGLQPPSEAPTSGAQVMTNSFVTANWVNGLTYLLNPPIFQGYGSVLQSIPANTPTALLLDTEVVDSYGGHSTTSNTSRYTAQAPGFYMISGSALFAPNASGDRKIYAAANGVAIPYSNAQVNADTSAGDGTGVALAAVFAYLNGTTDYVELYVVQTSGGALNVNPNSTNLSGMSVLWMHA